MGPFGVKVDVRPVYTKMPAVEKSEIGVWGKLSDFLMFFIQNSCIEGFLAKTLLIITFN